MYKNRGVRRVAILQALDAEGYSVGIKRGGGQRVGVEWW